MRDIARWIEMREFASTRTGSWKFMSKAFILSFPITGESHVLVKSASFAITPTNTGTPCWLLPLLLRQRGSTDEYDGIEYDILCVLCCR